MTAISTGGANGQVNPGYMGGVYVASSFGPENTSKPEFRAQTFVNSDRVRTLTRRHSYFLSTNHDHKTYDFEGRLIPPGPQFAQPLLSTAGLAHYVPLKSRRPSSPYRLARVIVNSFTALLFGHGRWPTIRVHGDPDTEQFARALAKEAKLRTVMIRARTIGGSVGTVGLSWRFFEAKPRVAVHNGKYLHVNEWHDREALIPAHVTEVYLTARTEWDDRKKKEVRKWFWYRRDWTKNADIVFEEAEYVQNEEPNWQINEDESVIHNDDVCHFVWIQNLPEDDETSIDGQPDYAELYEELEEIDVIKSVVTRGAKLNLDPTLVLQMDPEYVQAAGIKKGSDNALIVGQEGNASYMELAGTSISAGVELFAKMRDGILETAQCVIPDPNELGGSGTSSTALKVIHAPMLSKCELLREQYGEAIRRLLQQMIDIGRERLTPVTTAVLDDETGEPLFDDETGEPLFEDIEPYLSLDPVMTTERRIDEATGEEVVEQHEFDPVPGRGGSIELDWGDYFAPTPEDRFKEVQTLQLATAGNIMSKESASEETSFIYERNAGEEWKKLTRERDEEAKRRFGMFDDAGAVGGKVDSKDELPEGAEPATSGLQPGEDTNEQVGAAGQTIQQPTMVGGVPLPMPIGDTKVVLGVSDLSKIVSVNEGRAAYGLGPLKNAQNQIDPDGYLMIAEFSAMRIEAGKAYGKQSGEADARSEGLAPEPAPVLPNVVPPV